MAMTNSLIISPRTVGNDRRPQDFAPAVDDLYEAVEIAFANAAIGFTDRLFGDFDFSQFTSCFALGQPDMCNFRFSKRAPRNKLCGSLRAPNDQGVARRLEPLPAGVVAELVAAGAVACGENVVNRCAELVVNENSALADLNADLI